MARIVAIDLPGGTPFVEAVRGAWADGDAILPIDRRLPPASRSKLIQASSPARLVDASGSHRLPGDPTELADGDALVVATSGTTGEPKLIVHGHAGLGAHARAVHDRLGVTGSDRWLACLPLAHIGGLGVVLRSIQDDVAFDVIDGFDAESVASAPERFGSTLVSLVPTALDRVDASSFRWVLVGGSADPAGRPDNVLHTYGSTETAGGIVYGSEPLDGVVIHIDDDGEILVGGPTLARGRLIAGEVEPIVDGAGMYRTGDRGRWVDDVAGRRLIVEGRADDLIITGGVNVWPAAVEALISRHPDVAEVAVFGVPDPEWGQRVVAAVVPRQGTTPSLESIRAVVRETAVPAAAPKELRLVEALPRTSSSKVHRPSLDAETSPRPRA